MADIETSKATDTGYTRITLLNYDSYQGGEHEPSSIEARIESDSRSSIEPASTQHPPGTIKNEKKVKTTEAVASGPSWEEHVQTFDPQDQELLQQVCRAIASTRKTGLVAPSVLSGLANQLSKYPGEAVLNAARIYLERDYAAEGKNERYLLGIVRGEANRLANGNGHQPPGPVKTQGQLLIDRLLQAHQNEGPNA